MGPRRSPALSPAWPLALVLGLASGLAGANPASVGTSSAAFLKLGSGARPEALGGAYVALADDAPGIEFNPAGMSQMLEPEIQASHTEWLQGLRYENADAVFPLSGGGTLGASFDFLSVPPITRTEQIANSSDPEQNYVEEGTFSPYDLQLGLAYSRVIYPGMIAGFNLKAISENIDGQSAYGLGLDLGGIVRTPLKGLNLGLSMQNLGTPIKFSSQAFDLPFGVRAGAAYRCLDERLLLLLETDLPADNAQIFSCGAELAVSGFFYPRLGWRMDGLFNPWSLGLGLKFGQAAFDMAVVPYGELGLSYRASLSYRFGEPRLSLALEHPYFSNLSGAKPLRFQPKVSAADKVSAWALYVYDSGKAPALVRSLQGKGPIPEDLSWDGRLPDGRPAPEGQYQAVLTLRYASGKALSSPYQRLLLNNSPPVIGLALDPGSANPEFPGEAFVPTSFKLALKSGRPCARWRLEILDPQERVFRAYAGQGPFPEKLVWDGKGEQGEELISGQIYQARLSAEDALAEPVPSPPRVSFKALLYR